MTDPSPSPSPSSNRGVMIVLSYLWLLALVPLLVEKEDKEVQWHAKHGLVLMVAEIVFWIALSIVGGLLSAVTAGFGCLGVFLMPIISLAFIVLHVFAIVKGLSGQRLIIPVVSEFADKF
jgi:uncharacterized membrane protein